MSKRIDLGWIGLGQMGAPMAERLLGEDVTLHVFDRNAQVLDAFSRKGAVVHGSPREVADAAEIVFACLPSPAISKSVALDEGGVIFGERVRLYVETSTIGRDCIQAIAAGLAAKNVALVDGPISGGAPAAREGRLTMMVSGPPPAVDEVLPWLGRIGRQVTNLGGQAGQAQIMKLVNNLVMAANMVVAAEGLALGSKAGLDAATMLEVLTASTGSSRALTEILAQALKPGSYSFGAHLSIVAKDVALGVHEASALEVPVPGLEAVRAIWAAAVADGHSDEDFTSIIRFVEKQAGTEVRSA
ncbi:NAD(P)-dependent oxidoreductase [Pseudomonas citronellolis]|uniref:NAD(P)-dependent oxidoreductase n=1 Tax=Pseudomonas citronellolis TaxID=53408 RepID=UPI0021C0BCE0|nr:NAD(P)-dependent oxidoreductase [Pseudomonas citronellolis]UXJ50784.1 NAD(P)-dependent oxidoreductase [Pseudomonas citronellolis]